jgi:PAS domain S-box-containing protein
LDGSIWGSLAHRPLDAKEGDVPATRAPTRRFPIIGIGASAGGLEPLTQFLASTPPASGAAYVIVQHMDPTQPTGLVALLAKATAMPVTELRDRSRPKPNHVYVVPPGVELTLARGIFHLVDPSAPRGQRLGINTFFQSLGDERGTHAVGVLLSGMGSDGLLGLEAIREHGGLTAVQEPSTADFDSMPRAAIDAGAADLIGPVAELPGRILGYLTQAASRPAGERTLSDDEHDTAIDRITQLLRQRTGNDFALYKRTTLLRRLERRMAIHQITTLDGYSHFLAENPAEVALLFKELLIGVTSFFRDEEPWVVLRDEIFPALIREHPEGGTLRAWVAACSTGEEAYSLAIVFREALDAVQPLHPVRLQIFATDLNGESVAAARQGVFSAGVEAAVSPERLQRFFVRDRGGYRVTKDVREMITFAQHNVVTDPPFTRLDLISCRNLLIYLRTEVQRRLLPIFHYALNRGGILMLGTSESAGETNAIFAPLPGKARLYRRLDIGRVLPARDFTPLHLHDRGSRPPTAGARSPTLHAAASDLLLNTHGPAALLVDGHGEIVWFNGPTRHVLVPATGQAEWSLGAMLREPLRHELLAAHREVLTAGRRLERRGLVVAGDDAPRVDVSLERLESPPALAGLVLVLFTEVPAAPIPETTGATGRGSAAALRAQLHQAREESRQAQAALQQLREELGSTIEEAQSTNEELQSTNEELTTSKEELQSMNEELQTINAEQVSRMETLTQAQSDMTNLLNSTEIVTLFLGPGLVLRRFTAGTGGLYRLLPSDIGRPLTDIVSDLSYSELADDATEVLRTLVPRDRELQARDGRWFRARVLPYRTIDDVIDGVVVTFTDITNAKRLEAELRDREQRLLSLVEQAPSVILCLDLTGTVRELNTEGARLFGTTRELAIGRPFSTLTMPAEFRSRLHETLEAVQRGTVVPPFEVRFGMPDGSSKRTCWVMGPLQGTGSSASGVVLMGQEILPTP